VELDAPELPPLRHEEAICSIDDEMSPVRLTQEQTLYWKRTQPEGPRNLDAKPLSGEYGEQYDGGKKRTRQSRHLAMKGSCHVLAAKTNKGSVKRPRLRGFSPPLWLLCQLTAYCNHGMILA
jgi:hypothetical protein